MECLVGPLRPADQIRLLAFQIAQAPMGLTLIEAATGCVEPAESRLAHLAVIKTFAEGELLRRLPFMNISSGVLL